MGRGFPCVGDELEVVLAQHRECTECHGVAHLKSVNFILYKLIAIKKIHISPKKLMGASHWGTEGHPAWLRQRERQASRGRSQMAQAPGCDWS